MNASWKTPYGWFVYDFSQPFRGSRCVVISVGPRYDGLSFSMKMAPLPFS